MTGATGFVGGHVLDALRQAGYPVRALVRGRPPPDRGGESVEWVTGDLLRSGALTPALRGCRFLVHVAALYSFAPRQRELLRRVNVDGTAGLLEAARIAGVERAVVTSSSATVGPAAETDVLPPAPGRPIGYHYSKAAQERVALSAQIPTVLLLPTAPVGPGDGRPTPTGQMVLDFARGRIVARVAGGMNLVPVEDVARAHVLALDRGRPGERYLLGGEDLSFDALWAMLAAITGRTAPRHRLPAWAPVALGWLDELRCRALPGARPLVPLEGARMSRHLMYASSARAERELGYRAGPVSEALERAVRWYREKRFAA